MKRARVSLIKDESGLGAVEFALAIPVLLTFIYGIFVTAMVLMASAGIHHALGEAARYATLFPTPTDDQIRTRLTDSIFGVGNGTLTGPTIVTDSTDFHKTISVTYTQPTNFIFFPGPTVTLSQSKRVYYAH